MGKTIPKRKMVVIEEGLISSMASNPAFLKEFPFLTSLARRAATAKKGCGSCGGGSARAAVYAAAKATFAGLAGDKKRRLKELLNAEKARVLYRNEKGKFIELTF